MPEEILRRVRRWWTEDTCAFRGQFYRLQGVRATPKPVQRPRPELWVGALGPAAVRRAARYADGIIAGPEQVAQFAEALAAEGRNGDRARVALGLPWLYVTDDPERAWRELYPHLSYQINGYQRWFSEAGQPIFGTEPYADLEDLQARGPYLVGTPEQVREALAQLFAQAPAERYFWWAIPPGLPPREAVRSMELFARQVMPHFRGRPGPCRSDRSTTSGIPSAGGAPFPSCTPPCWSRYRRWSGWATTPCSSPSTTSSTTATALRPW